MFYSLIIIIIPRIWGASPHKFNKIVDFFISNSSLLENAEERNPSTLGIYMSNTQLGRRRRTQIQKL